MSEKEPDRDPIDRPIDREVIVPEPPAGSPWRRAIPIAGALWIVLHLLIPQRYYGASADVYDERFAWRMFSSVRVRECSVTVTETRAGDRRQVALMRELPAPWVALLERNRPAVVERFLRWRCGIDGTSEVAFHNACRDATGDTLAPIDLAMTCDDRVLHHGGPE